MAPEPGQAGANTFASTQFDHQAGVEWGVRWGVGDLQGPPS